MLIEDSKREESLAAQNLARLHAYEAAELEEAQARAGLLSFTPKLVRAGAVVDTVTGEGYGCGGNGSAKMLLGSQEVAGQTRFAGKGYTRLECVGSRLVNGETVYEVRLDNLSEVFFLSEKLALEHFGTGFYEPNFQVQAGASFQVQVDLGQGQTHELTLTVERAVLARETNLLRSRWHKYQPSDVTEFYSPRPEWW